MMATITRTETRHLLDAAGQGGEFSLPETWKTVSRERLLGRLMRDGFIVGTETGHRLTPSGYRAIGLRPRRAPWASGGGARKAQSTKDRVLAMLRREEGATLAELVEETGWLPHTTRAALSRLRKAGEPVLRSTRDDSTVYRIATSVAPTPAEEPAGVEVEALAA